MPVEYSPIERYRSSSRPTCLSVSAARVRAWAGGRPLIWAMCVRNSDAVSDGGRQSCSGMYPRRDRISIDSYGRPPSTWAEPEVGLMRPRNSLIAVLLPAPFGPSSPVTPSPMRKSTPSSAITAP